MEQYDLIVIGGGSGLQVASAYASRGKQVAVVEPGPLGGTCLNRGCIPSKMLIHHADVVKTVEESEKFDIDAQVEGIDFETIVEKVNEEVSGDAENIRKGIESSENHTLYEEEAEFVEEKVLEVGDEKIKAGKIVVAAGSRPMVPPIDGVEEVEFLTSKEALKLDEQPESMVMIGGGYISLELAYFYSRMGTQVTILERGEKLLKREDREVSEKVTELSEEKYDVVLNASATKLEESGGKKVVRAETEEGEESFEADEILLATGRVPNTDRLEVEEAGLETGERGFLQVDNYMETSVENIYALGDIAGNWMFKHSANLEAEYVVKNSLGGKEPIDYMAMPHAVFTDPQIAGVGKTEQELEESDKDYLKATYDYEDTGMGMAMKDEDGFVKVLTNEEGKILGCHIVGPEASTLIHEVLIAMKSGSGNIDDIKDAVHIHPALNEVVQRAFNQV